MTSEVVIAPPLRKITKSSEVTKFSTVVAKAFSQDELNRYFYLGRESNPDHLKLKQPELLMDYWEAIFQLRFENGSILIESYDWAAVALWNPPGVEKKRIPAAALSEGISEFLEFYNALREETLGDRHYWNLNTIARDPTRDDKGAITAIFAPFVAKAKADNLPIWLECSDAHAKAVYEHFGFQVVGEKRMGKSIVGSDGWARENGEGVRTWGMVAGLKGW